jgi:hypothetical protein
LDFNLFSKKKNKQCAFAYGRKALHFVQKNGVFFNLLLRYLRRSRVAGLSLTLRGKISLRCALRSEAKLQAEIEYVFLFLKRAVLACAKGEA